MKEYRFEKSLDFESNGIEKLNELAKSGWIVKIKVIDGILLERDINEVSFTNKNLAKRSGKD